MRYGEIWHELHPGQTGADAIDEQLHSERIAPGSRAQLYHRAPLDDLPAGAFVLWEREPYLVLGDSLLRWTAAGYVARTRRPTRQQALLITPPSLVAILRAGWQPVVPFLHPSAMAP